MSIDSADCVEKICIEDDVKKIYNDIQGLSVAYSFAEKFSTDPSTNNGAIIVNDEGKVLSYGANHFPRGIKNLPERWERPAKYQYVEHAEREAIFMAAREGIKVEGTIMYCPWYACPDCARAIIETGVREVVGHQFTIDNTPERWMGIINIAWNMLTEAGVKWRFVNGKIGDIAIRFNESIIYP